MHDPETNYDRFVEPLAKENVPTLVTPAIWNWNEIFPDYHRSFLDINGLTAAGRKYKTLGMLNTGWTDCEMTLYASIAAELACGAAAAQQAGPVNTNTFFARTTRSWFIPNRSLAAGIARRAGGELLFDR